MKVGLVSVVVPVYNGERWVAGAIESLLAQDYEPIEIVVVDDGSTDASVEVIERYGRQVELVTQPNAGVAAARNTGLTRVHGSYIAFCDQDDRHHPNKTSLQIGYLEANPACSLVLGRQRIQVAEGVDTPNWLQRDEVFGDLGGVLPLSCLVRREVADAVGEFDTTLTGSDDFDWIARMLVAGYVMHVLDDVVLDRWVHDANASHESQVLRTGALRAMHKILQARRAQSS
jgi:glycosyltransferase involved in cell wall biosynthesis